MRSTKSKPDPKTTVATSAAAPAADDTPSETAAESLPGSRTSQKVEVRLNPYIAAHQKDFDYYTKLVAENPERAVRSLMLKDLEAFEATMKRVERQMPYMEAFYNQQTPEVKKRIDDAVAKANPYHHDQAFVGEVIAESKRQGVRNLFVVEKPAEGASQGAAASVG